MDIGAETGPTFDRTQGVDRASVGGKPLDDRRVEDVDLERIAWQASMRYGFTDRPRCDPRAIAVAMGLAVELVPGMPPHIRGTRIVIPASACDQAQAYFVGHEIGHYLLRGEDRCEGIERACSRIGVALMLPAGPFARDVCDEWHALERLWPLASRTVLRRRAVEIRRLPLVDEAR